MSPVSREKIVVIVGWVAAGFATLLFVSFIDQIRLNLGGAKGSILLPFAALLNCSAWVLYGSLKTPKDFPVILPNAIGVALSVATVLTAVF